MKLLEIIHPAARTLVDISLSQDAEVTLLDALLEQPNLQQPCSLCGVPNVLAPQVAQLLTNSLKQCSL